LLSERLSELRTQKRLGPAGLNFPAAVF